MILIVYAFLDARKGIKKEEKMTTVTDYMLEELKLKLYLALTCRQSNGKISESDRKIRRQLLLDPSVKEALGIISDEYAKQVG